MSKPRRSVVYVIGAGLSAGLGFPTINNLLPELWPRLKTACIDDEVAEIIRFHHPDFNPTRSETYPTIEQLLSEMKANADLFDSSRPAVGGFTIDELDQRRAKLLNEIAVWFHELKAAAISSRPDWLSKLVVAMKSEEATIISFNWDLVLDQLLFGASLTKSSYGLDRRKRGARLIKPHGSLNWYKSDAAAPLNTKKKFSLAGTGANEVFAFRPLRAPVSKEGRQYMPLIVPPVYAKQFEGPLFQRLWREAVHFVSIASEVRFLGFSMAEADFHARFVLRCGFYNQEHGELNSTGNRNHPTGRAKVVIVDRSDVPLRRIQDAVGWNCEFHHQDISAWIDFNGLEEF